ncbi:MAG: SDR family oxidoreductase [Bacteroidetes bacterium]|nr:SDR family oxidoreductase [Bacteroidota bacterium]
MNYEHKIVWITGASSGIGKAMAEEYAQKGAFVILSSRNVEKLQAIKDGIGSQGAVVPLDLSDENSIMRAVEEVMKKYEKVDILVNNGGISQRSLVVETPLEVDRKLFEVNYFGNIALTKAVLPYMIKNKGGSIGVISSITGKFGFPLRASYAASKHALHGFYETLRAETQDHGINVTIICPGRIKTDISINALNKRGEPSGEMDPGQANGMPAEKCAAKIVRAIEKNKKEVLVGGTDIIMVYIRRFLPFLYYKIVSKIDPK